MRRSLLAGVVAAGLLTVLSASIVAVEDPPDHISPTGTTIGCGITYACVSWSAVENPDVTGYKVYRSQVSGGPYTALTPTQIQNTEYTDTSVSSGNTYYYVVTAIYEDIHESGYSAEVSITIS